MRDANLECLEESALHKITLTREDEGMLMEKSKVNRRRA